MLLAERLTLKPQRLPAETVICESEDARYKVVGVLGTGVTAYVYEVIHMETRIHYAMKVIDSTMLADDKVASLVANEAKIHGSLSHRNVVKVYRVFWAQKMLCFLMELCPYGDLESMLDKRRTLRETEVLFFLRQLIAALDYLSD